MIENSSQTIGPFKFTFAFLQDQKKLESILLAEKEAIFGSKPSPKRTSSLVGRQMGTGQTETLTDSRLQLHVDHLLAVLLLSFWRPDHTLAIIDTLVIWGVYRLPIWTSVMIHCLALNRNPPLLDIWMDTILLVLYQTSDAFFLNSNNLGQFYHW